ncbi:hypothetical protein [Dictyobacter kobayashii]|uniref:Uncharacterized protein n=1 Tax=Dictyobacter kobayashii TaxID=2014872 RepID=A0A402ADX5_9CHLR|nr:hypothetical protein [Dictyobacter kobayashii]GCE17298.1 hypothetical protein KDK_10980 [Dictyobacter kobayashii]
MTDFHSIAFREDIPVMHTRRNDGLTVIATRVPLKGFSEKWGWILSLEPNDGVLDNENVEALYDNTGRRYPKIYTRSDMAGYIDRWACHEWEPGYSDANAQVLDNDAINLSVFKENLIEDVLAEYKTIGAEQLGAVRSIVESGIKASISNNQKHFDDLRNTLNAIDTNNKLADSRKTQNLQLDIDNRLQLFMEDMRVKYEDLHTLLRLENSTYASNQQEWIRVRDRFLENLETIHTEVQNLAPLQQQAEQRISNLIGQLQTVVNEVGDQRIFKEQVVFLQKIDECLNAMHQRFDEKISKLEEEQKAQSSILVSEFKNLQQNMGEIQNSLIPIDVEDDSENLSDESKKIAKNAKTMSEKFMASIITANTRYYNTADKEVKNSFKQTNLIIYVGLSLLVFSVVSFLVTFFFHSNELAIITSGSGALLAAVATALGGMNKFHDKRTDEQLYALGRLDHMLKATHTQFLIEQIEDKEWQKQQLGNLINVYLSKDINQDNMKEKK